MRFAISAAIACFFTSGAWADGVPLNNGRYVGATLVLKLTAKQKGVIDHFRTCHLENFQVMNIYTPYVFELNPLQKRALRAKPGSHREFLRYTRHIAISTMEGLIGI
jgi:hypothetical protein